MPTNLLHTDASLISGQDHATVWKSRQIVPSLSRIHPFPRSLGTSRTVASLDVIGITQ